MNAHNGFTPPENTDRPDEYEGKQVKVLLCFWIVLRSTLAAVVWTTLIWTTAKLFYTLDWVPLFSILLPILFTFGLGTRAAPPSLTSVMLAVDPKLVAFAIFQALVSAIIPTLVVVVVVSLVGWHPDWLNVFLFFVSAFYILWRRNGKKKAVQAWKGTPQPEWKSSGHFKEATPVNHLPAWQGKLLEEHRVRRTLNKATLGSGIWTGSSDGSLVMEAELYWVHMHSNPQNKKGFLVDPKESGYVMHAQFDCTSEKEAMDLAEAWMLHGIDSGTV
jgi:hypothetical protein